MSTERDLNGEQGGESGLNAELDDYQTEGRRCCNCKNFKDMGIMQIPICTKKLMGVTRIMRVTFKMADSTCFEPMTPNTELTGRDTQSLKNETAL